MRTTAPRIFLHAATLTLLALVSAPLTLSAQASINLPGSGGGISPFGKPNTQTYGQTFKTPDATNTVLDDFSFWLGSNPDGLFRAYVYAWDPVLGHAVGPQLFASSIMNEPTAGGFQQVLVSTGGVALNGATQYVAFFSTSGLGGSGTISWELSPTSYSDGDLVWKNNGEDFAALTSSRWDCTGGCYGDLHFNANFTPVVATPEPASVVLLATGLMGVLGLTQRRRRS